MRRIGFIKSAGIWPHLRLAILVLLFLTVAYPDDSSLAQQQQPPSSQLERKLEEQSQEPAQDVVRIRTDLVQTSVTVTDKRGKFVDNLRAEDFELRIDGQPYPVLFFDRVINGVAADPSKTNQRNQSGAGVVAPEDRTRTVLFFVDDLHLSGESMVRARKMLSHYIEQEMGENDEVVIASASGQLGFLQQLTNEKDVLRAAVERLKYRPLDLLDSDRPRMSAHQASLIERGDTEVLEYFVQVLLNDELLPLFKRLPQLARDIAIRRTHSRAERIVRQSVLVATQTLSSLNSAVRSSAQIPGRKLFVFVSDGFLINGENSEITSRLRQVADAAVHSGAVLYTIQASGLNTTFPDASSDTVMIAGVGNGRVFGEDSAQQDPLTALAADTGGKAVLNANDLDRGVKRALQESNDYYLLAWRPETAVTPGKEFHRIEVSVKGHPDLSVLVQRGFFKDEKSAAMVPAKAEKRKPSGDSQVEDLAAAIKGRLSSRPLQTSVMANYLDVPNRGARLSILMQVNRATTESGNAGKSGIVEVAGVIYDSSGKLIASFVDSVKPETNSESQHITYLNQFDVKPGLYQVRGAARDSSGLTGMAMQWVKVPDFASQSLTLSSLLIGERELTHTARSGDTVQFQKAQLKIDRRFVQNSRLRFVTFIYNSVRDATNQSTRLNARVDLFRGNKAVVSTPAFAIETGSGEDPARIPYAGEFNLASLPKGNYRMRVTITDLNAKAYASQRTSFEIE